jgi:hypothetical protein
MRSICESSSEEPLPRSALAGHPLPALRGEGWCFLIIVYSLLESIPRLTCKNLQILSLTQIVMVPSRYRAPRPAIITRSPRSRQNNSPPRFETCRA